MFLALQHSTYAAIHDLVPRAMVLEAAVLLLFISEEFLRRIQGENLAWSTAIVLVFFLNKMGNFQGGNTSVLCSGISVEWMFTSVCRGCCEAT